MPTLDAEPEAKEEKENEKTADGSNGKVINKDAKEKVKDKNEQKSESDTKPDIKAGDEEKVDEDEPRWIETADGQIEMEDPDDYLIYLEDILNRIHQ